MEVDRKRVLREFRGYVGAYDMRDPKIALKAAHTVRVARLAEDIARADGLDDHDVDLAWLLGMLHDIGRFEQVRRYGTFVDADSVSHAALGAQLLFEDGASLLRSFVAEDGDDELVRTAVACHSAYELPQGLDARTLAHCQILRDADKVDILRVNCQTPVRDIYPFGEEELAASALTPLVETYFFAHQTIPTAIKVQPADMIVGHVCLVWGLTRQRSYQLVVEQGFVFQMLGRRFLDPATAAAFERMDYHLRSWLAGEGLVVQDATSDKYGPGFIRVRNTGALHLPALHSDFG